MKTKSHSEWEHCATGELSRMVGRIKAQRRVRLMRRVAMGSAAVLLLAVSLFSSTRILRQNTIKPDQQEGSVAGSRSVGAEDREIETARADSAGREGAAGQDGAIPADSGVSPDRKIASEDEEAIAVIKEKVDEAPAKTKVSSRKRHMNCNVAQNLMMKFIRKELDEELSQQVKDHIVGCKWCHKWYTALGGPPLTAQSGDLPGDPIAASDRDVEWLELASTPWMRNR